MEYTIARVDYIYNHLPATHRGGELFAASTAIEIGRTV